MRFLPKGGIWKNTEDEILKACVMKYGLNQWSRISSLLTRKSAKQCKARWYESLDPSIKKTEWSKEEEEKLLHLAKIMPTQWRTIAPIIGRTAAQCLEHYEKLISSHEAEGADVADPKRLRPGEIDPAPESKPARPDPVDMDEDELEMLQEARARLANTKGKKAKRKARERMLSEARRLAAIQQKNELQAAGIKMQERRVRETYMDYNIEIPFHIKQPIGFYDTYEEDKFAQENKEILDFKKLTSERFEGNPVKKEALERRKDIKRQKLYKEINLPDAVEQINRLNDPQLLVSKRESLQLPAPQVSNEELENIARLCPDNSDIGAESAAGSLLSASSTPGLVGAATPSRTPLAGDFRKRDIEDNIALSTAGNPLLGGESVTLNDPHFAKKGLNLENKKDSQAVTPNVLVSSLAQKTGLTPLSTPLIHGTPITPLLASNKTPLRDSLNINTPSNTNNNNINITKNFLNNKFPNSPFAKSTSLPFGTPSDPSNNFDNLNEEQFRKQNRRKRRRLQRKLDALPQPKLRGLLQGVTVSTGVGEKGDNGADLKTELEPDMDDVLVTKKQEEQKKLVEEELRLSSVSKRHLPRPLEFSENFILSRPLNAKSKANLKAKSYDMANLVNAEKMIIKEFKEIVKGDTEKDKNFIHSRENLKYIKMAEQQLKEELENLTKEHLSSDSNQSKALNNQSKATLKAFKLDKKDKMVYDRESNSFVYLQKRALSQRKRLLKEEFERLKEIFVELETNCKRSTSKIDVLLAGLQKRVGKSLTALREEQKGLDDKRIELFTFKRIHKRETFAIPLRHESLKKDIEREINREKDLQKRYQKLFLRYKNMLKSVAK